MPRRSPATAAILVALSVAPTFLVTRARAQSDEDEQSELDKARNAYLAHQYDEANERFQRLLDAKAPVLRDRLLINQARMYWAAVLIARHERDEAAGQFRELLLSDPTYAPDPLAFPTEVVNAFIDTRARLTAELNAIARDKARRDAERKAREEAERKAQAERLAMLERLAGEEKTVEVHSRWVALLPFGVGQFQNGQKSLGWVVLATEAALAASAAVTLPIYLVDLQYRSEAYAQSDNVRAQEYLDRAKIVRTVNLSLDGALLATALVGIIQAEIAFVPEEAHLTRRPLPAAAPPPTVSLDITAPPPLDGKRSDGWMLGLRGTF